MALYMKIKQAHISRALRRHDDNAHIAKEVKEFIDIGDNWLGF